MNTSTLLPELERFVKAGEAGRFDIVLNEEHASPQDAEVARLVNMAIKNYRGFVENEKKQSKKEQDSLADTVRRVAGILLRPGIGDFTENITRQLLDAVGAPVVSGAAAFPHAVDGLDIARGLESFGGDKEEYVNILRSYTANTKTKLGLLETLSDKNLAQYEITVHGIKGASLGIFAEKIGKNAGDLEKAVIDGDLDYINKYNPLFLEAAWKFIRDLEDMLSGIDAEKPREIKDKPDNGALSRLLAACEMYDMAGVDAAMAEITGYHYESDDGLAEWLRKNAEEMNYELIVEKLSGII